MMTTAGSHLQSLGNGRYRVTGVRVNPTTGRYYLTASGSAQSGDGAKNSREQISKHNK